MSVEKKQLSFLATLELKDGTKLAFSKVVANGERSEAHEYLCANSLARDTLKFYFRAGSDGEYVLLNRGVVRDVMEQASKPVTLEQSSATTSIEGFEAQELKAASQGVGEIYEWEFSPPQPSSSTPEPTSPVYLGVNAGGWVFKTDNSGLAYVARIVPEKGREFSIESSGGQYVHLTSGASKNPMQTYKRESFPNGAWFTWMTDRDGVNAVLKLTILERYDENGAVRK
ncbi:hypothetical protein SAMN05444064_101263 [Pseudomonas syringae]|uniref:hypothetical protein n=1 Tax=Pseudomonas syringae TaxID=317 RepID=UPI00089814FF|nr:hypothetical protein [Pseudomonas syringae]SDW05911.1 hypothetical protein SAMN05444514_101265 [Pseudomonas syringae]SFL39330.1 hypothetical protein SAMN05444064_101263 [Pseudomonas syringae]